MHGMMSKVPHASDAIELGLHVCINLLTFCAVISTLHSRPQGIVELDLYHLYVLSTLGSVMCCSMLHAGSRISSWIGYSLLSQLSFLAILLFEDSFSHIHIRTTFSGLFVLLLALHITSCSWKEDVFHDIAVIAFHIRLISATLEPWSHINILLIAALFLVVHRLKWLKNYTPPLKVAMNVEYVYIASLAGLELFIWSSFLSTSWLSPQTLTTLGFALCLRWCRLELSAPELLLILAFVRLAMCCLWHDGGVEGSCGSSYASSHVVLAVSAVGVLGILLVGVVTAIGMNGMMYFEVVKSASTPGAAVCFTVLLVGVIVGFMLPGMEWAIAVYMPEPPQLSVPLPVPLLWVINFLTTSNPMAPSSQDDVESQTEQHPEHHQEQQELFVSLPLRLGICVYWILALVAFLPASEYICQKYSRFLPQIASRKLFHFLSVAMFTPIVLMDVEMMFLSFSVALCALILIEYIRYFNILGIQSSSLNKFYITFMDERDLSRKIALTHIQLLLGCALPFMLSFGLTLSAQHTPHARSETVHGEQQSDTSDLHYDSKAEIETERVRLVLICQLLPYLGLVTVGIGDAMAAIIGSKYGRHRWVASSVENKRTVEGTLAGCVSMYICAVLICNNLLPSTDGDFLKERMMTIGTVLSAAIIETFTFEADNIIMPLAAVIVHVALGLLFTTLSTDI